MAVVFIAVYAALALLRATLWDALERDEAEQVLWSQSLALGYGSQPPLYTWIQQGLFAILGVGIPALSILKFGCLAATMLLALRAARELTREDSLAALAALSYVFIPEIAWESIRDRSHLLLATAFTGATLLLAHRLPSARGVRRHILLGVAVGAGVLSKYNFIPFALALLAAGLTLPRYRTAFLDRRMILAALACAAIVGPHAVWAATHTDRVLEHARALDVGIEGGWWARRLAGLWSLGRASAGLLGPLLLAYAVACRVWRRAPGDRAETGDEERLLLRSALLFVALCALGVVVAGARVRDRWMLPGLMVAPIWLVLRLRHRLTEPRRRGLALVAAALLLLTPVAVAVSLRLAGPLGIRFAKNAPYPALARHVRSAVPAPAAIVADSLVAGGHLRLAYPGTRVVAPGARGSGALPGGPLLLVWHERSPAAPSPAFAAFAIDIAGVDPRALAPDRVEAAYRGSTSLGVCLAYAVGERPAGAR